MSSKIDKAQKEHLQNLLSNKKYDRVSTIVDMNEAKQEYETEKKIDKSVPYKNNKSSIVNVRMKTLDIERLEKHFKLQGIVNKSTGFRQIIYKYMNENNLL